MGRRETAPPPVPSEVKTIFDRNLIRMLDFSWPEDEPILVMSESASDRLRAFEAKLEPRLGPDGDLGSIADWASKLVGAIARIAGILHLAWHIDLERPWNEPVLLETIESAIAIGDFYLAHAKAAFAEMGADPEVEAARHVLRWIECKGIGAFSERDAYQALKGRFKKVSDLRPVFRLLVDHGYVRERPRTAPTGPGRPASPIFDANPHLRQSSEDCEDIGKADSKRNGISGDIEDIGGKGLETHFSSPPSTTEDSKSISGPHSQNSHNPQNPSPGPLATNMSTDEDTEVFEV
jgi:hypothetical protein